MDPDPGQTKWVPKIEEKKLSTSTRELSVIKKK
jgi:hypothetical protein